MRVIYLYYGCNLYKHTNREKKEKKIFQTIRRKHDLRGDPKKSSDVTIFTFLYFLAKEIFIAELGVILKPWSASRAEADCISFSNSTKAMSWRPGTRRTSLKPGNCKQKTNNDIQYNSS
jgi:hypothetical protein